MEEYNLTDKDHELIMDIALAKFMASSYRFSDSTSLCKAYVLAIEVYSKKKGLTLKEGKWYKNNVK